MPTATEVYQEFKDHRREILIKHVVPWAKANMPDKDKAVEELTDGEKMAVLVMAGEAVEYINGSLVACRRAGIIKTPKGFRVMTDPRPVGEVIHFRVKDA